MSDKIKWHKLCKILNMTKNRLAGILFLLSTLSALTSVRAENVRFVGKAAQFSGHHLIFYRYSNFIIPETSAVISLEIDKNGNFDYTFPISETFYAFVDLGRFRGYIFLEPGLTYELVLPPFEPKTQSQKLNPHFQPEEIPLGIANKASSALTRNIVEFNEEFEYLYNSNAVSLFMSGNAELANKIEKELEGKFPLEHPYFKNHKQFSYLKLWHTTLRRQERRLIYNYLSYEPVNFNLPVYWEIYKTILSGYLPGKFAGTTNQNLAASFKVNAPFDSIVGILTTDSLFASRKFAETALLFTLFESFYSKSIAEQTVLSITQSAMTRAEFPETREMARQYFVKMSQLRPGTSAPSFTLTDRKGKIKNLEDYEGKFVYLNFVHTKNHACLRDLQTIEQFEKNFRKELTVVSIVMDEDFETMEEFLKKNNRYNWDFLHFSTSPKVLFDYNIKGVPTYFLIDPQGKLILSPAPAPEENFRQIFIERYREYQRSELRKNPPRERSIFKW